MKQTILLLLFLTACAQQEQVEDPVIAEVPVAVSCVPQAISVPQWNVARLAANATAADELKAVLADLDASRGVIGELEAELAACG